MSTLRRLYQAVQPVIDRLCGFSSVRGVRGVHGHANPVEALEPRQLLTAIVVDGTSGNDTYLLRTHPDVVNHPRIIQLFDNATAQGEPLHELPLQQVESIQINGNAGDDKLIVDVSLAAPFPNGLLTFDAGGQGTAGDTVEIRGYAGGKGSYRPSTGGNATFIAWRKTMNLVGIEAITAKDFRATEVLTPASGDVITLDTPATGQGKVSASSGGATFVPLTFSNTASLIVDAAYNDGASGGNDAFTISNNGVGPAGQWVCLRAGIGNNTLNVNGGTTNLVTNVAPDGAGFVIANINNSAVVNLPRTQYLAELHINNTAQVKLPANAYKMLLLNTLTISSTAKLDLADNDLIVHNGNATTITALIRTAYANGAWTGYGITTSTFSDYTALGIVLNQTPTNSTLYGTWSAETLIQTDVLVRFSYTGDANLDGVINADDYFKIDSGYIAHATGWYNGDFTYDTLVNADDYFQIDSSYYAQGLSGPLLTVSGAGTSQTGARYTLTLDASTARDAMQWVWDDNLEDYVQALVPTADDPLTSWTVYWGDGEATTLAPAGETRTWEDAGPLITSLLMTAKHVYSEPGSYKITVAAKGTYLNWWAGNVLVEVSEAVPELPMRGAAEVNEGDEYTVYLSSDDAGTDILRWEMDWGDGTNVETVLGNSASLTYVFRKHSAEDGWWVVGKAYDQDDAVIGIGSCNVVVKDVAPTVAVSGLGEFDTRDYYWLHLRANDVGDEEQSSWLIDWGDGNTQPITVDNASQESIDHLYSSNALPSYTVTVKAPGGADVLASQPIYKEQPVARWYLIRIGTDTHFPPSPGDSNPSYIPDSTAWLYIPDANGNRRVSTVDYVLFDPAQQSPEQFVMQIMHGYAGDAVFPTDAGLPGSGKPIIIDLHYDVDAMQYRGTVTYNHPPEIDPTPHVWPISFQPLRVSIYAASPDGVYTPSTMEDATPQPQVGFMLSLENEIPPGFDVSFALEKSGDATPGQDYTLGSVTIPHGPYQVWVPITVLDDDVIEPDEMVVAAVGSRQPVAPAAKGDRGELKILDNDFTAKVHDLTYGADKAGAFHKVWRDYDKRNPEGAYPSPHWTDLNGDGDADDANENKAPVSYTRSGTNLGDIYVTADVTFKLTVRADLQYKVKAISGNATYPMTFSPVDATVDNGWLHASLTSGGRLPDTVYRDYAALTWFVSADNGTHWKEVGQTENRLYVSYVDPGTPYHTVMDVATRGANGKSTYNDITSGIWWEFTGVPNGVRSWDGFEMHYWGALSMQVDNSVDDLVHYKDGRCGAWASFLVAVWKTQGTTANVVNASADKTYYIGNGKPDGYLWSGMVVKSMAAQGMPAGSSNREFFDGHAVVELGTGTGGHVYDPSYGRYFYSEQQWMDAAEDYFKYVNPSTQDVWKGFHTQNTRDCNFVPGS
ncbi:MAG: hypothetical protein NTU53_18220 [Planctomycetota bacterium]|nr:hypothetical protein [Planctomycetota bacterium]